MKYLIALTTLGLMVACSPEAKIRDAEADRSEAQMEANKEVAAEQKDVDKAIVKGNENVAEEQADVNKAQREADEKVAKADQKVDEAKTELEKQRNDGVADLWKELQKKEDKITELRKDAAKEDAAAQGRLERNLGAVSPLVTDARQRLNAVQNAEVTAWKAAEEQAKRALAVLEDGIDQAGKYKNADAPAPVITPLAN